MASHGHSVADANEYCARRDSRRSCLMCLCLEHMRGWRRYHRAAAGIAALRAGGKWKLRTAGGAMSVLVTPGQRGSAARAGPTSASRALRPRGGDASQPADWKGPPGRRRLSRRADAKARRRRRRPGSAGQRCTVGIGVGRVRFRHAGGLCCTVGTGASPWGRAGSPGPRHGKRPTSGP